MKTTSEEDTGGIDITRQRVNDKAQDKDGELEATKEVEPTGTLGNANGQESGLSTTHGEDCEDKDQDRTSRGLKTSGGVVEVAANGAKDDNDKPAARLVVTETYDAEEHEDDRERMEPESRREREIAPREAHNEAKQKKGSTSNKTGATG
jgi:hypothetical protein